MMPSFRKMKVVRVSYDCRSSGQDARAIRINTGRIFSPEELPFGSPASPKMDPEWDKIWGKLH
jgi:hypothetical protein